MPVVPRLGKGSVCPEATVGVDGGHLRIELTGKLMGSVVAFSASERLLGRGSTGRTEAASQSAKRYISELRLIKWSLAYAGPLDL